MDGNGNVGQESSAVAPEGSQDQRLVIPGIGTVKVVVTSNGKPLPGGSAQVTVNFAQAQSPGTNQPSGYCPCCPFGAPLGLENFENESLGSASAFGSPNPNVNYIDSSDHSDKSEFNKLIDTVASETDSLMDFHEELFSNLSENDLEDDFVKVGSVNPLTSEDTSVTTPLISNHINEPNTPMCSTKKWVMNARKIKKRKEKGMSSDNENSDDILNPCDKKKSKKTKNKPKVKNKPSTDLKAQCVEEKLQNLTDWTKASPELIKIGKADDDDEEDRYFVEKVLGVRMMKGNGQRMFLVKWQDWPEKYNTWEPQDVFNKVKGAPLDVFLTSRKKMVDLNNDWTAFKDFERQKLPGCQWEKVTYVHEEL